MNSAPEGNASSNLVTKSSIGAEPEIGALAEVVISATPAKPVSWLRKTLKIFGPGLVTGAADDDPSGIATYSQVGAQLGFSSLWLMLFSYPLMAVTQEISARIGRTTGRGLAGNLRRYYAPWIGVSCIG